MKRRFSTKHMFALAVVCLVGFVVIADVISLRRDAHIDALKGNDLSAEQKVSISRYEGSSNRLHAPYHSGLTKEQMLEKMRVSGCVADGFLSGYGDEEEVGAMLSRSECQYAHRALETWREAPDFDEALRIMELVGRPMLYGMFIAEAIDTKDEYHYGTEDREFSFRKMCKPGSQNYWGEHTCVPHTSRNEYRRYIDQITKEAMDAGIRVFLFGQVFMQDDVSESYMPEIVRGMREYAQFLGIDIVVGAQTNDVEDEEYLRLFDFIEGGVGLRADGSVDPNKCSLRWWNPQTGGWCWALLAHDHWKERANNVFVHLDWNGNVGDEMNLFASMSQQKRAQVLSDLHAQYLLQGVGFLLPFLTPLDEVNGGCYGEKARYYSPDIDHGCKDEGTMNAIMKSAKAKYPEAEKK